MKIETVYLSAAVNQTKKSLDWNAYIDLIAYAASNRIVLYDPQKGCVVGTSDQNHGGYINCVHWIQNDITNSNFLLSTSSDGSAKLWVYGHIKMNQCTNSIINSVKALTTLQGHKGSISCGHAVTLSSQNDQIKDEIFAVTTADDFLIKGWKVNIASGESEVVFNYKLPGRSLALELLIIPSTKSIEESHWPLVVYGGDDGKVHLMTSSDGKNYEPACILSGHQDWITSLSYSIEDGDILLSSGSKDGLIRLWRISCKMRRKDTSCELLQVKTVQMKLPKVSFKNEEEFIVLSCSLESVLHGHDGLVSNLDWDKLEGECHRLLSCSKTEDRSLIIWEPEVDDASEYGDEIWVEKVRLGEVGGNREGFFSAKFGPNGDKVAASSYQGGLHLWHCVENTWVPQPIVSGHFNEVVDLDWDEKGKYLLTVSKDQTTRLHSRCDQNSSRIIWQEIARPQVHGYDMTCVACLDQFRFASAGEEKVVRGFTATKSFVNRFQSISPSQGETNVDSLNLPDTASVSSLGLSNKGEEQTAPKMGKETILNDVKYEGYSKGLPTEDELMMGTLWPEVSKLYGHGNELLALAASHDGTLLASSCKATTELDAKIILWNTKEWREEIALGHHRLSVTQIEFSSCDQFLLSVSRDRSWAAFQRDGEKAFSLKSHSSTLNKKCQHSRIIWSCAWVPKSLKFLTGSRDKSVVIWNPVFDSENHLLSWERGTVFNEREEVVAVAVTRLNKDEEQDGKLLIAIGCANGSLLLRTFDEDKNEILESSEIEVSHQKSIRRLKFRPGNNHKNHFTLASCGSDNTVFLYEITV